MEFRLDGTTTNGTKMWENLESTNHKSRFYYYIFHKIFIYTFLEKTSVLINLKV